MACISPTQQLAQGPRRKELQGKLYPRCSQELLQAEPSTGRVSLLHQAIPPADLEVKAQGTWGEEGTDGQKELVPWVREAGTHD